MVERDPTCIGSHRSKKARLTNDTNNKNVGLQKTKRSVVIKKKDASSRVA